MVTTNTSTNSREVQPGHSLTTWDSNSPIDYLGVFPSLMQILEVHQEHTMKRENGLLSFPGPESETNENGDSQFWTN